MARLFYHDALRALTDDGVEFVIVGGVAVNLQGVPRFTADLDLAVRLDRVNLMKAAGALSSLGLRPRLPVAVEELADADRRESWVRDRNLQAFSLQDPNNPLRQVDLLITSPVSLDTIFETSIVLEAAGLRIRIASVDVLIAMKQAAGRAQDLSDIEALERLTELADD